MNKTGYDRYLEFQFRQTGEFHTALFNAIQYADQENIEKLRLGFPEEVHAYLLWSRSGKDVLLAMCSPEHPLVLGVLSGEYHL